MGIEASARNTPRAAEGAVKQQGTADSEGRSTAVAFVVLGLCIAGAGVAIEASQGIATKGAAGAVCYGALAWTYATVARRQRRIRKIATELTGASREIAAAAGALASANE